MSICESFHVVVVAVAKVYRVYFGVKEESAVKWVEYGWSRGRRHSGGKQEVFKLLVKSQSDVDDDETISHARGLEQCWITWIHDFKAFEFEQPEIDEDEGENGTFFSFETMSRRLKERI